jgi:hypothetical protein
MSRANVVRSLVSGEPMTAVMLVALLTLTACSAGSLNPGGGSYAIGPSGAGARGQPSLATQQACRQRTSEIFEKRNRPEIYAANPSLNSPFSANFQPDVPSRGLSTQFAYEQTAAECERNAGTASSRTDTLPAAAAPAASGAKVR